MLAAFAAPFSTNLFPQATSGDITGTVLDASGSAVARAKVAVENEATGVKGETTSDAGGVYRFSNLPVGSYSLTASAAG